MSTNCRSQFTAYLRNNKIKYSTWPGHIDVNDFRFHFLNQSQRIVICCGYDVPYTYSIPYACPDTIIKKTLTFSQCINQKFPYKIFLLPVKKLSRPKQIADKKICENEASNGPILCE